MKIRIDELRLWTGRNSNEIKISRKFSEKYFRFSSSFFKIRLVSQHLFRMKGIQDENPRQK